MKKITLILWLSLLFSTLIYAQKDSSYEKAMQYLREKGEVIFTFKANNKQQFLELNQFLSVSHKPVDENQLEVEAYANKEQFQQFLSYGLAYRVSAADNVIPQELTQYTTQSVNAWDTTWDAYPKYSEYVAKMQYWAATYPNLCSLQNIGATPNGRALYVLKISDNVTSDETEPEFFYTSSMHGDEITGYVTMLRLIDYLLTNYGSLAEVTNIVNGTELYINPLANPDGSYRTAGNDIYNSVGNTPTRGNVNGIDLNRNYPDAIGGLHPDASVYQPETRAFLNFQATRNFVLSANYHGGTEVVNFPLDTSNTPGTGNFSYHPHDNYFKLVSIEYAQLCQTADNNLDYMDTVYNTGQFPGTTNGAAWYSVFGGRQDCSNYFDHNKEVTIEISNDKTPLAANLPFFWDRNRQALLNYIKQATYGLHGIVTDQSGNPIHAKVYIGGTFDNFGSWVETSPTHGDYHKVQIAGTYNVIFEAPGYVTQTLPVTLTDFATTTLNVTMVPTNSVPSANDVTICTGQTASLTATGTGTIRWYNAVNATTPLASTANLTTPPLTSTTSYWVERETTLANLGPATVSGTGATNTALTNRYLIFNCTTPTKLKSVTVSISVLGDLYVELQNSSGVMLESKVIRPTATGAQDIALDFFLPAQNGLRLVSRQLSGTSNTLTRATSGITYPITNGTVTITGNSGTGIFFQFFNWKFEPIRSNRDEVIVTVTPNPTNSSVNPNTKTAGSGAFTLTVNGSNFINGQSIVRWNGTNRTTTFVSSSQLTADITAADIATAGTATITVFNTCNSTTSSAQTVTITSPNLAASLNFDGLNDRVVVGNTPQLEFGTQNLTLEAKIKLNGSQSSFAGILSKATVSGFFKGIQLIISGNRIGVEIGNGTNIFYGTMEGLLGTQDLNDNNWHHVAVVVNRATKAITLYVDGTIQANLTSDWVPLLNLTNSLPLYIGVERTGVSHFNGEIDEVHVWSRALCISEIQANMNCEATNSNNIVANYHFNQGFDSLNNSLTTSLLDSSTNNINGTLTNFTLNGATSNWVGSAGVPSGISCSAFVDTVAPVPTVPSLNTITAQCSVSLTPPTALDTCAGIIVGTTPTTTITSQGTHIITWTYNDGSGNITTQNQTVTIDDTVAPIPSNQNLPTLTGQCEVIVSTIPTANDNCTGTVTGTTNSPLAFDVEGSYTINWVFDDGNGNTSSQNQFVIVDDTVAPEPIISNLPTLTDSCSVTATAPSATDACMGIITATTNDPTSYSTVGTYSILWIYDDGNGNISTQNQTVVILSGGTLNTYYADNDGDGFGNNTISTSSCSQPVGYVTNNSDCNDNQVQYADVDGDGFGSTTMVACGVLNNTDCNDNQVQYADIDGDGFGSSTIVACGVLNNTDCNDNQVQYADADGDGFGSTTMAACGIPNNVDCNDNLILYLDADNDGFGSTTMVACNGSIYNNDCNDTNFSIKPLVLSSLTQTISTPLVSGASMYRFRVTNLTTNQVATIDRTVRTFMLTQLPNYAYNTSFYVEVAVRVNAIWSSFSRIQPCLVISPNATTKLQTSQCGINITSLATLLYANNVAYVTGYRFRITDASNPTFVRTFDTTIRSFRLSNIVGTQINKTYQVDVALKNRDGNYLAYGPVCMVSTNVTTAKIEELTTNSTLNLSISPNPFEDNFSIRLFDEESNNEFSIEIYDMLGRLMERKAYRSNEFETVTFGNEYPSGIYTLFVTDENTNKSKSYRIIKR